MELWIGNVLAFLNQALSQYQPLIPDKAKYQFNYLQTSVQMG
jgi:hypothetical protein